MLPRGRGFFDSDSQSKLVKSQNPIFLGNKGQEFMDCGPESKTGEISESHIFKWRRFLDCEPAKISKSHILRTTGSWTVTLLKYRSPILSTGILGL